MKYPTISKEKNIFINISPDITGSELLDTILTNRSDKIILITNENVSIKSKNIIVSTPRLALRQMYTSSAEIIIIYNVYPLEIFDGYIVEIILQEYKHKTGLVLLLYLFDFKEIIDYGIKANIYNLDSKIDFTILSYEKSKSDFLFEIKLNYKILPFIDKNTVIYCATSKSCISTATFLLDEFINVIKNNTLNIVFDDDTLLRFSEYKIGLLHHNTSEMDKNLILELFKKKKISILVTTHQFLRVKADTIILKSTKEYVSNSYSEMLPYNIVNLLRVASKNSSIYLMTTRDQRIFYTNLFIKNRYVNDDKNTLHKDTKLYNFSSLEGYIPEFILTLLYYKNSGFADTIKYLQNTFFFYRVMKSQQKLDLKLLLVELLEFLEMNRFIIDKNHSLNNKLVEIFFTNTLSIDSLIIMTSLKGTPESIINNILKIKEIQSQTYTISKLKKNESVIQKLLLRDKSLLTITNILNITLKIKEITKENFMDVFITKYKLNSKKLSFLDLKLTEDEIIAKDFSIRKNSDKFVIYSMNQFKIIIEHNGILKSYISSKSHETIDIPKEGCEVNIITSYQVGFFAVKNQSLTINKKYYSQCGIKSYAFETTDVKNAMDVSQKVEIINGCRIELFTPESIN